MSYLTALIKIWCFIRLPVRVSCFFIFIAGSIAAQGRHSKSGKETEKDSIQILAIGKLAEKYFANKEYERADSLIEKQLMLAEESLNKNLVLLVYFGNIAYQSVTTTKDRPKNTLSYIKRALEFARSNELPDYVALATANMAAINNADGKLDEGFRNASQAYTDALNTDNDSAKVVCAIQLGNTYLLRSDILMAFKVYTNAQNIANQYQKKTLLPAVFNAMGGLYKRLGNEEMAKQYVHQSLYINKEQQNIPGQINDYIFLAKASNYLAGKEYLQTAVQLADSIDKLPLKIEAERILFFHMIFVEKPASMLRFLEQNQDLKNVFINTGPEFISWMYAEIFLYGGIPDSALNYFRKAESSFVSGYDLNTRKGFFEEYADCLERLNNIPAAITYFQKGFEMANSSSDLRRLKSFSFSLKKLYQKEGDFKQAFHYGELYDNYKDSVDLLGKERDFAKAEIENLTKEQQRVVEVAKEEERRKHNLQYLFITLCVGVLFVLLIMLGMFRVSTFAIRAMGFFSLIFFFEFIILILDKWIHHMTHGEPWKILLIKIGIVSILLPTHHFIEHKLIHYLLSKRLITLRSRLSFSNLFRKKKAVMPPKPEDENPSKTDHS